MAKQFSRTGAYGLIIQNEQIFLTKKKLGPHKGYWDLPGGGLEYSETPLEALHRELIEEAALTTQNPTLLTVIAHHGEHEDYRYHHIGIIYRIHNTEPTHTPAEEEGQWFSLKELKSTQTAPFVTLALEHLE
ncbi:MAG: hypothetical protein COT85_07950 [Chlamydiae bacterium CG10_big_fil_rev_8_21_14_0_10_42_34]|nr:MAG: hypothetical protein COT85_07950 [Chlamydiae bacterium CG10_big_fil_rev_8_21_14_0_10_42_34]